MIVRFTCPSGHRLKADSELCGREAACPACGGRAIVPAPEPAPVTESGAFRYLNDCDPESPQKPPDWSQYAYVTDLVGEIVKADDKKLTLRVTWFVQQVQGGINRRPNLNGNNRNFRNPFTPNRGRPPQMPRVTVKEQHHDYELEFVPESLVRVKSLPPKFDDKGKRVAYTPKELQELKQPRGVVGYSASPADLLPGTVVDVFIVRDKSIPAAKATEGDLRVKYALIIGTNPNQFKDFDDKKADRKDKK